MKSSCKWMLAIAGGAIAGAVLGILFAPAKGTDTRKKIREKGAKVSGDFREFTHDLKKGMKEADDIFASRATQAI